MVESGKYMCKSDVDKLSLVYVISGYTLGNGTDEYQRKEINKSVSKFKLGKAPGLN